MHTLCYQSTGLLAQPSSNGVHTRDTLSLGFPTAKQPKRRVLCLWCVYFQFDVLCVGAIYTCSISLPLTHTNTHRNSNWIETQPQRTAPTNIQSLSHTHTHTLRAGGNLVQIRDVFVWRRCGGALLSLWSYLWHGRGASAVWWPLIPWLTMCSFCVVFFDVA